MLIQFYIFHFSYLFFLHMYIFQLSKIIESSNSSNVAACHHEPKIDLFCCIWNYKKKMHNNQQNINIANHQQFAIILQCTALVHQFLFKKKMDKTIENQTRFAILNNASIHIQFWNIYQLNFYLFKFFLSQNNV